MATTQTIRPTGTFQSATRAQALNELRLLLREPAILVFAAVLPIAAVLVMSAIPGARQPLAEFGGLGVVQAYTSTLVLFSTTIIGLTVLPTILGGYREMGVLRRLRTTPASPTSLLVALFLVLAFVGVVVMLVISTIPVLFGVGLPKDAARFAGGAVWSLAAFLGLGALLAAVIPNPKAASGIGNVIAAVMWFFGGMWFPRAMFPDWLTTIADLTPGGAATSIMNAATFGGSVGWLPFVVLVVWTAAAFAAARATFRWE